MIGIKRTSIPKLLAKTNKEFKAEIQGKSTKEAYEIYKRKKNKYKYNTDETKRFFRKMNNERCSFCTKHISDFEDEMTVEHIKTKKDYPRYIYQWSNLLCSCKSCNTKRSTNSYVKNKYLDPSKVENIEEYFCYKFDGEIVVNDELDILSQEKADYMIKLYKLNRRELVCKRREFLNDLIEDDDYLEILKNKDFKSQNIIFLSVFTYYTRRYEENYGK